MPKFFASLISLPSTLRAGAFVGLFFAGGALWLGLLAGILLLVGTNPLHGVHPIVQSLYSTGLYLYLLGLTLWFWHRIEGASLADMGLTFSGKSLGLGALFGFGMLLLLRGAEMLLGLTTFHLPRPSWLFLLDLLVALLYSVSEEVVFRGALLQILLKGAKPIWALSGAAAVWALGHYLRPNLTLMDLFSLLGLIVAGILLGLAYLRTRSLWLPIGIHAGWIYVLSLSGQLGIFTFADGYSLLHGGGSPNSGVLGIATMLLCLMLLRKPVRAS
ncbi:MAG: lysostaphin resistance A-like protein [Bacteroidota bacterium]